MPIRFMVLPIPGICMNFSMALAAAVFKVNLPAFSPSIFASMASIRDLSSSSAPPSIEPNSLCISMSWPCRSIAIPIPLAISLNGSLNFSRTALPARFIMVLMTLPVRRLPDRLLDTIEKNLRSPTSFMTSLLFSLAKSGKPVFFVMARNSIIAF